MMCALAVAALEDLDIGIGLVGEDDLEAMPVVVGVNESCAPGCARSRRTISRDPRAMPGVDLADELGDLTVAACRALRRDRGNPGVLGDLEDRLADLVGQLVAHRGADVAFVCTSRSGHAAQQQLDALGGSGGDLLEGQTADLDRECPTFCVWGRAGWLNANASPGFCR